MLVVMKWVQITISIFHEHKIDEKKKKKKKKRERKKDMGRMKKS